MDLENFYNSLFNRNKNYSEIKEDLQMKEYEEMVDEYKSTPRYKTGMFVRLIINGTIFRDQIIKMMKGYIKGEMDDIGEILMYLRAWSWIKDFDIKDKEWIEAINSWDNDDTVGALDLSLKYFEDQEEYEKCAHLLSIKKCLKNA